MVDRKEVKNTLMNFSLVKITLLGTLPEVRLLSTVVEKTTFFICLLKRLLVDRDICR